MPVTVHYLEMTNPAQLNAKPAVSDLSIAEAKLREFRFNRYLYQLVGDRWQWHDKLSWSDEQWQHYAHTDSLRTWVAYHQGSIAGYYELKQLSPGTIEIAYFGLAPDFIGKGFGGYLLSHAIASAWAWGEPSRVCVNTCSLDHAAALSNYQARGMRIYKTEIE